MVWIKPGRHNILIGPGNRAAVIANEAADKAGAAADCACRIGLGDRAVICASETADERAACKAGDASRRVGLADLRSILADKAADAEPAAHPACRRRERDRAVICASETAD